MARVFLIYGARGAGKTTATLKLAEALITRGLTVGGYFQRTTTDDLDRRGYDLVRVGDPNQTLPLARPGGVEKPETSTVCSFAFSQEAFLEGAGWLMQDAESKQVLVIDEISKLEVRGEGHGPALRWALALDDSKLLLLSVRADQLFYVVEAFGLEDRVAGYLEIPAEQSVVEEHADLIVASCRARPELLHVDGFEVLGDQLVLGTLGFGALLVDAELIFEQWTELADQDHEYRSSSY